MNTRDFSLLLVICGVVLLGISIWGAATFKETYQNAPDNIRNGDGFLFFIGFVGGPFLVLLGTLFLVFSR